MCLYVSGFYQLFTDCWTLSTFFHVMGLPLSWSVVNHISTNNDSDMNMKNIFSLQRKMDMKLAFYIFLWVLKWAFSAICFLCSSLNYRNFIIQIHNTAVQFTYIWQEPILLRILNSFCFFLGGFYLLDFFNYYYLEV